MPITGLVLVLENPTETLEQTWQALATRPEISCGELQGNHLPVVSETEQETASRDLHDWLSDLPGVLQVDVVFVGLDESEEPCR